MTEDEASKALNITVFGRKRKLGLLLAERLSRMGLQPSLPRRGSGLPRFGLRRQNQPAPRRLL